MTWAAQSLQFALFCHAEQSPPDALSPWQSLFKTMPQNFQQSPPGIQPAQSSAMGIVQGYTVTIVAQVGRYDLHVAPLDPGLATSVPLIEDVPALMEFGLAHAKSFIEFQPALRLAFVLNLAVGAVNQSECNDQFARISGTPVTDSNCTDHVFQVNNPFDAVELGQRINRLVRLQTQVVHLMTFAFAQLPGGAPLTPLSASHLVTMTVDINTVQGQAPFEKLRAHAILERLAAEALNTMNGDYAHLG